MDPSDGPTVLVKMGGFGVTVRYIGSLFGRVHRELDIVVFNFNTFIYLSTVYNFFFFFLFLAPCRIPLLLLSQLDRPPKRSRTLRVVKSTYSDKTLT